MDLRKPPGTNRTLALRVVVIFGLMFAVVTALLMSLSSYSAIHAVLVASAASLGAALTTYRYQRR